MFLRHLHCFILILPIFLLNACTAPAVNAVPELTFKHLPPIALKVSDIILVSKSVFSTKYPRVGYRFQITPEAAVKKWALDRLQIGGGSKTARFTILDARALETKVNTKKNLTELFKRMASERYDVILKAQLEILDKRGTPIATVTSTANWIQTVREDTSLTERQNIWFSMIEKSINQLDSKMEQAIRHYMAEFLF